jgi:hypothetical protein
MTSPAYLPYSILGSSFGIIAAVILGVNLALKRASWPEGERRLAVGVTAVALVGWFGITTVLAYFGAYQGALDRLPTIQYGIVLPILIGGFLIWRSSAFSRLIHAVPQQWVVAIQLYRALGVIFLVLYASDRLPALFAWPAGAGDITIGLLAPVVALAYARDPQRHSRTVLLWNLFGIADLIVAIATGFVTSPSPLQLFAFDHPNELISAFPLVLVPTFAVPLAVLLHVISLTKLARATTHTKGGSEQHPIEHAA